MLQSSIHSRTAYVISALVGAQSDECRAKRAADFIHHINQYPEARDYAIKVLPSTAFFIFFYFISIDPLLLYGLI